MLLVIDVGNTNIVFGLFDGPDFKGTFRLMTETPRTADEIGVMLIDHFTHIGLKLSDVSDVVISSVVPQVMYTVTHAITKYVEKSPLIVDEHIEHELVNLAEEPLGADRVMGLIGAREKYGAPLILLDFGTATKADALNDRGEYMGGLICPGIKISMDALFLKAARLPRIEIRKPDRCIGVNTVGQMQAGAVYGYVGSVEYIVANMKREMGYDRIPVIATGGLSSIISEYTAVIDTIDRALVMNGLRIVYEKNKGV